MKEIKIVSRWDNDKVLLCGKYESVKECLEKNRGANLTYANLIGANLTYANLTAANHTGANLIDENNAGANLKGANHKGANLIGANLTGANLTGANLTGAKGYYNSHAFFAEVVRRQKVETFTNNEWRAIGQIVIHILCWDSIHKRF